MARVGSPGQSDSDHEITFGTDGERWCACNKCLESEPEVEDESNGHSLLREIEEKSKRREQRAIKQNSRTQNYFLNQCRILEKQRNAVKERLKKEAVSNILENYTLLREAEKCQDERLYEEGHSVTKKKESYIRKSDVPTMRIRNKDSCSSETLSKQTFKKIKGTDLRLFNLPNFSVSLSVKGETLNRSDGRNHGRPSNMVNELSSVGASSKALSKVCVSSPTSEPSERRLAFQPVSQSCPPDFHKNNFQREKGIHGIEQMTNNRSLSQLEGEYFHEKIQNFFQRKNTDTPPSPSSPYHLVSPIMARKQNGGLPSNNAVTCKKRDFVMDAAKSGYKWIFTPGTETEIQKRKNQNVNMKEKIQIRSTELANIRQELKRNERKLDRLVRKSRNLVKDIS